MNKTSPFDRLYIGLLAGLLFPMIVFYLYFKIRHWNDVEFSYYLSMIHKYGLLFKVMSLCVLSDLPLFYAFIQFKFWRTSRGIVMACFIYALFVAGYRLFT
jgi:hypothetical protein